MDRFTGIRTLSSSGGKKAWGAAGWGINGAGGRKHGLPSDIKPGPVENKLASRSGEEGTRLQEVRYLIRGILSKGKVLT